MGWFANQRTAVKLTLSFGVILLILLTVIIFALSAIKFLDSTNKSIFNQVTFEQREKLSELIHGEDQIRASMLGALLSTDRNEQQKFLQEVKSLTDINDSFVRDINKYKAIDASDAAMVEQLNKAYEAHRNGRMDVSVPLIMQGKVDEAKKSELIDQKIRFEELRKLILGFSNVIRENANDLLKISEEEVYQSKMTFIFLSIIAVFSMVIMVIVLNRQISAPLNAISKAARQMALGDLKTVNLPMTNRTDEVGTLVQTFSEMSRWIQGVANTANQISSGDLSADVKLQSSEDMLGISFQLMIKNLRKLTREISEAINLLNTSAIEISSASSQLAASASESATSVNETTTTIEEVRQTSHVANQKAQLVSKAAENTSTISESGKHAASEINTTIDEIQRQMSLIADSMVRLSEQTQAIGAIITTVDDLSQQSNLLSVNASIEAAKAGEQGKGFAVVAQEVKSLASQSKQATNQVRAILNDIQKATSASVMATEQGSKAVEQGVKKSEEAGQSILMLVNSVSDASNAAAQIAVSSQQQLIGMEQATMAMENIKQTSLQNVESSKQLESSVKGIIAMGDSLKGLIGQFKLNKSEEL